MKTRLSVLMAGCIAAGFLGIIPVSAAHAAPAAGQAITGVAGLPTPPSPAVDPVVLTEAGALVDEVLGFLQITLPAPERTAVVQIVYQLLELLSKLPKLSGQPTP